MAIKKLNTLNFGNNDTYVIPWENVVDKPFSKKTDTIEWDGTDSSVMVPSIDVEGCYFHHVNDSAPDMSELFSGSVFGSSGDDGMILFEIFFVSWSPFVYAYIVDNTVLFVVAKADNLQLPVSDDVVLNIPKKGIYFPKESDGAYVSKLVALEPVFGSEKLNPEVLPEHVHEANGYIEGSVVVLPETIIEIDEDGQGAIASPLELTDGSTYTVVWNGVKYETKCVEVTQGGTTVQCLGNIGLMMGGESTGEPFIIVSALSEGITAAIALDGSTSVTLSIKGGAIVKMDPRLLPDHTHEWSDIPDAPFGEKTELSDNLLFTDTGIKVDFGGVATLYHVSSYVPQPEDLIGATIVMSDNGNVEIVEVTEEIVQDIDPYPEGYFLEGMMVVFEDNSVSSSLGTPLELPKKGIYFMDAPPLNRRMEKITFPKAVIETTKVTRLDPKYLPEGLGYIGQPKEIYPETTIELSEDGGMYGNQFVATIPFTMGETYIVNWNGVEYECECQEASLGVATGLGVGNPLTMGGEDNGLPFGIGTSPEYGMSLVISLTELTTTTFSIKNTGTLKKIDERLLPEGISNPTWNSIVNKPFEDIPVTKTHTLTWDGESGDLIPSGENTDYVYMSSSTPSISELIGAIVTANTLGSIINYTIANSYPRVISFFDNDGRETGYCFRDDDLCEYFRVVYEDNSMEKFTRKGIYFHRQTTGWIHSARELHSDTYEFEVGGIKKLDTKYLEDSLSFGSDFRCPTETLVWSGQIASTFKKTYAGNYNSTTPMYKVHNKAVPSNLFIGGEILCTNGGAYVSGGRTITIADPNIETYDGYYFIKDNENLLAIVVTADTVSVGGLTLTVGIYFSYVESAGYATTTIRLLKAPTKVFEFDEKIRPLDKKYLPEHLQFGGEEVTPTNVIEFDGNLENAEYYDPFIGQSHAGNYGLVKLYDTPITKEAMLGGTVEILGNVGASTSQDYTERITANEDNIVDVQENVWKLENTPFMVVTEDDTTIESYMNIRVPKGVYTAWAYVEGGQKNYLTKIETPTPVFTKSTIKTLDPKYLPKEVATKDYVDQVIGGIENGTY